MSYAAEPYAQFVEDLLLSLTGGLSRERFVFLPENAPFRLAPPGPIVRSSLHVFGQVEGAYHRFALDTDFALTADAVIEWKASADDPGTRAADATWPDEGTAFYANYDHQGPSGVAPRLNDRNPGSLVRLLSESFAREYAVLSRQLEGVYRAGFLETAGGRDLDQLVALVGVTRRDRTYATGAVVFGSSTPAPADVTIPEGTRLSTAQPPAVEFETTAEAVIRRGSLSVEVPIRARESGPGGVVPAGVIAVIHRTILGIEGVENPQGTSLSGKPETDEALRARARRALQSAGKATVEALTGALTSLSGIREKYIRIDDDPVKRPGVVVLTVAAELTPDLQRQAINAIEEARPAGVRVIHRLAASPQGPATIPVGDNPVPDEELPQDDTLSGEGMFAPVVVAALLVPTSGTLGAEERAQLKTAGENAVRAVFDDVGVGDPVVYNRLVAKLMAVSGVQDVVLELYQVGKESGPRHHNILPGRTERPTLAASHGGVVIGGEVLALDVDVEIELLASRLEPADREAARVIVLNQLREGLAKFGEGQPISRATLAALVKPPDWFRPSELHYVGEYPTAGVRLTQRDQELKLQKQEVAWVRDLTAKAKPA